MKSVITTILLVGFAVSAVGFYIYDGLWGPLADKKAQTEAMVNNS